MQAEWSLQPELISGSYPHYWVLFVRCRDFCAIGFAFGNAQLIFYDNMRRSNSLLALALTRCSALSIDLALRPS